jgi:EAL domain-containing protein (putative c-di-GMP-specific phosphodiesterase class I)
MAFGDSESEKYRDLAFAAADLLIAMDARGNILEAAGDGALMHHPTADRLIGKNALDLISEGNSSRLRQDLWALGPGRRIAWEDATSLEGGRLVVVRRGRENPDSFNLAISRPTNALKIRGDSAVDVLSDRFRDTVMNGRLKAALQPVVDTRSGALSHYEVLARFNNDESPTGMIEAAEKSGQISHLDYIMVCAAAARLEANPDPAFRLAVNISGESVQHMSVVNELCAAINGHEFRRNRLILEVTESAEITDITTAAHAVKQLQSCGVSVTLDDFGSGAASFNYLRTLEVDGIKFDGSFLESSSHNHRTLALMRNVARMCSELGLSAVGERVETKEDLQVLQAAGVKLAQGYFFGTPNIDEEFFSRQQRTLSSAA